MDKFIRSALVLPMGGWWAAKKGVAGGQLVYRMLNKRKPTFGDAAWAQEKLLYKRGHFNPGGFAVGSLNRRTMYTESESSVLMLGRPGLGKSLTMGKTLHDAQGEHFIVRDAPGDNLRRFRSHLEAKGYIVRVINLDSPLEGDGYDPFRYFSKNHDGIGGSDRYSYEGDMDLLGRLVVLDAPVQLGADKHFTEISLGMVCGLAAYFQKFEPEKANLAEVARVLTSLGKIEMEDMLAKVALCSSDYCRKGINAYHRAKVDERGSMDTTNSRKVRDWSTASYRDLTRTSTWCWEDVWLSARPVAVFVVGGVATPDRFSAFERVFFGQCCGSLARMYGRTGRPLPRPVKIMVDEGALLGRCEPVVNAITQLRKVGVSVFISYQDFEQMKRAMGDLANTIKANCDRIVVGWGNDIRDYEEISRLIGKRTGMAMSKGQGGSSESETGIPNAPASEMRGMDKGECVVLMSNLAVKCRLPYEIHKGKLSY